jgi:hypothetical protein
VLKVFRQTTKLITASALAILLASSILVISDHIIPDKENFTKPPKYALSLYQSVPLAEISINNTDFYPQDIPILHNGSVYTFTGDILNSSLVIQKDNIVINGNGHSFKGYLGAGNVYGDFGISIDGRRNVTISNLNLVGFSNAIIVNNSTIINISENNISNTVSNAINVSDSSDIIIGKNTISFSGTAIKFNGAEAINQSLNNNITENIILDSYSGVQTFFCSSNIIKNRFSNVYSPIWIASNYTNASENTLINGIDGIIVGGVYGQYFGGSMCTISENVIKGFTQSGLYFNLGANNTIHGNTIINTKNGVSINLGGKPAEKEVVKWNTFYENNFINNTNDIINNSEFENYWDNGKSGNFWSKLSTIDSNHDNISDTPHIVSENNIDRYPLMNIYGNLNFDQSSLSQTFASYIAAFLTISIAVMTLSAIIIKRRKNA